MENEFVPYEEALALKELGLFLNNCFGFFISSTSKPYSVDTPVELRSCEVYTPSKKDRLIQAPLYQQAFRWFREEHDMDITPIRTRDDYLFAILSDGVGDKTRRFKSYEEAELDALRKLIERVKDGK